MTTMRRFLSRRACERPRAFVLACAHGRPRLERALAVRWVVALFTLLAAANSSAFAQTPMAAELPSIITTAELERLVERALTAPPSAMNALSPALADHPLAPEVRRVLEVIEPAHDMYLDQCRTLIDDDVARVRAINLDIRGGATLREVHGMYRAVAAASRRAEQFESALMDAIAAAFPEAQRPRALALRREVARTRIAKSFPGTLGCDLFQVMGVEGLSDEERALIAPVLAQYETRLMDEVDRYVELFRRHFDRYCTLLESHEDEYLAAMRADPVDNERLEELRAAAGQESGLAAVFAQQVVFDELQRRTFADILPRLAPASRRRFIDAVFKESWSHDPRVRGASTIAERIGTAAGRPSEESEALVALRDAWFARDAATAEQTFQAQLELWELEGKLNPAAPDYDAIQARVQSARGGLEELLERRGMDAHVFISAVGRKLGAERAETWGMQRADPEYSPDNVEFDWIDSEQEAAFARDQTDPDRVGALDLGSPPLEAALPFATLIRWVRTLDVDDAAIERIRLVHEGYESRRRERLTPFIEARSRATQAMSQAYDPSTPITDAFEAIDRDARAEQAIIGAVWQLECDAADEIALGLGNVDADGAAALRIARLWLLLGAVNPVESSGDAYGRPRRPNAAALALEASFPQPVRRALANVIGAQRAEIEAALRRCAERLVESVRCNRRENVVLRLNPEDPEARAIRDAAIQGRITAESALLESEAVLWKALRAALAAPRESEGVSDDIATEFESFAYAQVLPNLMAGSDRIPAIIAALAARTDLTPAERTIVDEIREAHGAIHGAATTAAVAAALDGVPDDPKETPVERSIRSHRRGQSITRWRFERDEADAKALLHLRNGLRREIVEQVAGLTAR